MVTRLAGTMVNLISQNQPSSLDAFIINFQAWVQFIVRTLPIKVANKGKPSFFQKIFYKNLFTVPLVSKKNSVMDTGIFYESTWFSVVIYILVLFGLRFD